MSRAKGGPCSSRTFAVAGVADFAADQVVVQPDTSPGIEILAIDGVLGRRRRLAGLALARRTGGRRPA